MRRRRGSRRGRNLILVLLAAVVVVGGVSYLVIAFNPCRNYPFPSLASQASQSLVVHNHDLLEIYVNDHLITINNGIGGGDSEACTQPLHNHGNLPPVIHIESTTFRNYTLGEYFRVWAGSPNVPGPTPVVFNSTQIFGYHRGNGYDLRMYVNGQQSTAYDSLVLMEHQTIVIVYGSLATTSWPTYQNLSAQPWPLNYP